MQIRIHRNPAIMKVELYGFDGDSYAKPVGMLPRRAYEVVRPFAEMEEEDAQVLLDELINAGFRPTKEGYAGHLDSVKYHLEDMRKLVFERNNERS